MTIGCNTTLVPLYINEMSPKEISGSTGSFNQLLTVIGTLIVCIFGLRLSEEEDLPKTARIYFINIFPIVP